MRTIEAVKTLAEWDRYGWSVFTLRDLRNLFPHRSDKTLSESLRRMVRQGCLSGWPTGSSSIPSRATAVWGCWNGLPVRSAT